MIQSPQTRFETYLADSGHRYSNQKKIISSLIFEKETHFEVDAFILELRRLGYTLSRATIYRTIRQLLEANLIQKIVTKDGKTYYERNITATQHDHIICNQCGSILELQDPQIDQLVAAYCRKHNFKPDYRSLHVYGLCRKCQ